MPDEPPIKRTIAFVDGQNLFHAAKEAFGYSITGLNHPRPRRVHPDNKRRNMTGHKRTPSSQRSMDEIMSSFVFAPFRG